MNFNPFNLVADFGPETIAVLIPIAAFSIPIIAILTKHQQKMAELIHRGGNDNQLIANLQREVYELRQMVLQHAVTLDDLGVGKTPLPGGNPPTPPTPPQPPSGLGGW